MKGIHIWDTESHLCRLTWWLQVTTRLHLLHSSKSSSESQRKQLSSSSNSLSSASNFSLMLLTSSSSLGSDTSDSSLESPRKQVLSASASIFQLQAATHIVQRAPAFLPKLFWQLCANAPFVKSLHFSVTLMYAQGASHWFVVIWSKVWG